MESLITGSELEVIGQLAFAAFLGMLIGLERNVAGKTAGMRTYALVTMGSCLFVAISVIITRQFIGLTSFDPLRVAAGVVMGIGFIGTGLTVLHKEGLAGLTTSAGIWVAAAVGVAVAFSLYVIAGFATVLTLFIFTGVWYVERFVKRFAGKDILSDTNSLQ